VYKRQFLPFIALVKDRLDIITLDGPTDYRRDRLGSAKIWLVPNGPEATAALSETFFRMTDYPPEDRGHVPALEMDLDGGRMLHVPKALKGVAVFSFKRLCVEARGAADYLAIARRFHTVFIVGIPVLGPHNRNERGAVCDVNRCAIRVSRKAACKRECIARCFVHKGRRAV
jgi:cell division protein ZapE